MHPFVMVTYPGRHYAERIEEPTLGFMRSLPKGTMVSFPGGGWTVVGARSFADVFDD